ncbi:MAG: extracellular solute-binding protein [Gammaproteobacteria bacterium]|jgi:iron(III) transport system substrate-binding protein|nr:extracellular solute-binding protein [Gammaproteobacteria bacterium]
MRETYRKCLGLVAGLFLLTPAFAADEVVVYSSRTEELIKPLFDLYTKESGVPIRYVTDSGGPLLARLKAEGANTPADVLITVDAGNLWQAAESGLLQPVSSDVLDANVPAHLRDPQGQWYGLSLRARTIVYSTARVSPDELSSYEDLADVRWKGRVCLRSSKSVYNQSLVAMMIARLGPERAADVVKGWVNNLATAPFANDTRLMEAMAAGQCDVGIVNSYYFGRLQKERADVPLALFWPNQGEGDGVHVNVAGAGVTRHAGNVDGALKLIEWLSAPEAQRMFAGRNMEYPVNPEVDPNAELVQWGSFRQDPRNIADAGRLQAQAVMLMDRAGYR